MEQAMGVSATVGATGFGYGTYPLVEENEDAFDFIVLLAMPIIFLLLIAILKRNRFFPDHLTCIIMATALALTPNPGLLKWMEDVSSTATWMGMFLLNVVMPLSFFAAVLAFLLRVHHRNEA